MRSKLKNRKGAVQVIALGVTAAIIGLGHFMYKSGEWGPEGMKAVKNCYATHTNGNCAHLPLTDFEKSNLNFFED